MTSAQVNQLPIEARTEGFLDEDGFFTQDDWEFELDVMSDRSREALQAHLDKAPAGHATALFLKGYLMGDRTHFTAFEE